MATLLCCCVHLARHQQKGSAASQSSFGLAVLRVLGGVCMFPYVSPWCSSSDDEMVIVLWWDMLFSFSEVEYLACSSSFFG